MPTCQHLIPPWTCDWTANDQSFPIIKIKHNTVSIFLIPSFLLPCFFQRHAIPSLSSDASVFSDQPLPTSTLTLLQWDTTVVKVFLMSLTTLRIPAYLNILRPVHFPALSLLVYHPLRPLLRGGNSDGLSLLLLQPNPSWPFYAGNPASLLYQRMAKVGGKNWERFSWIKASVTPTTLQQSSSSGWRLGGDILDTLFGPRGRRGISKESLSPSKSSLNLRFL